MLALLLRIQTILSACAAHPVMMAGVATFFGFWIGAFVASRGAFDPGLGIGNIILNLLGTVLTLSACALAARAASGTDHDTERHDALHAKLDSIIESHKSLHAKADTIRPMRRRANGNAPSKRPLPIE